MINGVYLIIALKYWGRMYSGQSRLQLRSKVKQKLIEIQNNCTGLFEIASLGISSRKYANKGINKFYTKHKRLERIWSYSLTRKSEEGL
jgi:hypothetical protein